MKYMVPIPHHHLKPLPNVVHNQFREMFSVEKPETDADMQSNAVNVSSEAAEQWCVVQDIRGPHDVTVWTEHGGGPLPEGRLEVPLCLRSYTVEFGGLFTKAAKVVEISGNS